MFSELLNGTSHVVSKSSAVHAADNPELQLNYQLTPVQDQRETSSRHVDSSNMHTFYQHHPSAQRWTKDHPLEQVIGNPSQSVRTRRQLQTDGKMSGNPVKKILLKLNLSDHRSILTDSKEYLKMVMERQSVKVKEIQERCIIKAFQDYQIKKGMSMSVQKSQVHEMAKFTRWREIMLG
ncbi:hypothetical protein Tco_1238722 [Tanacetum coccineum]